MELRAAQVTNFRSIKDSGIVELDRVISLVGKNESGKTNFLQALARLNPAPGEPRGFDLNDDYPRAEMAEVEHELLDPEYPRPIVVRGVYQLSDEEIAELHGDFGEGVVTVGEDNTVSVSIDYDGKRTWSFTSEPPPATSSATEDEEGAPETAEDLTQRAIAWFKAREPFFLYFDEYDRLAPEGNVRELLEKRENGTRLKAGEKTFLALIDEAKFDLDRARSQDYAALVNGLESASIRISKLMRDYWSQNQRSVIDFDHTYVEDERDPHQRRRDLVLQIRVKDTRHNVSTSIERRSGGFVWFVSFMVNFARIKDKHPGRNLVLLLDEPGTALHGLAQADFLRVLDGKLSEHQIIYTTHQPFLVDPNRLDRARPVVEDGDNGTKVRPHAYKVDSDTLFPLQAALGYAIGQTLFVAPNVLLVEGTSDLIYLQLLSRRVERDGATGLDRRWTITPVGGVDKMDTFVRLFQGQQLNICALIDAVRDSKTKLDTLVEKQVLQADQVVRLNSIVKGADADIEDLFDPRFYLSLVNGVGQNDPRRAIYAAVQESALPAAEDQPRVTKRIDAVLAGFDQPKLDHNAPAIYFERNQDALLDKVNAATAKRAEKLFALVNAQLHR